MSFRMRNAVHNVSVMLADIPRGGICVEVGTWIGESAVLFAAHFDQVICVDAWPVTEEQVADDMKMYGCDRNQAKAMFLEAIAPFNNIAYIHDYSHNAARLIPDASVAAVYIDADHRYPAVKQDCTIWPPKIKPGGYICGHDYTESQPECVQAINEVLGKPHKVYGDNSWLIKV